MARRRHLSRIAVLQTLFEWERREGTDVSASLQSNTKDLGDIDKEFAEDILRGVIEKKTELWDLMKKHAPQWSPDRMDPISRCLLLIGTYELEYAHDAPPAGVITDTQEFRQAVQDEWPQ